MRKPLPSRVMVGEARIHQRVVNNKPVQPLDVATGGVAMPSRLACAFVQSLNVATGSVMMSGGFAGASVQLLNVAAESAMMPSGLAWASGGVKHVVSTPPTMDTKVMMRKVLQRGKCRHVLVAV